MPIGYSQGDGSSPSPPADTHARYSSSNIRSPSSAHATQFDHVVSGVSASFHEHTISPYNPLTPQELQPPRGFSDTMRLGHVRMNASRPELHPDSHQDHHVLPHVHAVTSGSRRHRPGLQQDLFPADIDDRPAQAQSRSMFELGPPLSQHGGGHQSDPDYFGGPSKSLFDTPTARTQDRPLIAGFGTGGFASAASRSSVFGNMQNTAESSNQGRWDADVSS